MKLMAKLIGKSQNHDKYSMELLIIKFEPILNSLSYKLGYDCAKTDLTIFFIKLIYSIKLESIMNLSEGALVNYIKTSFYREYYRLSKAQIKNEICQESDIDICINDYNKIEGKIFLDELVLKKVINEKQKYVLMKKYCHYFTDEEISKELCISRQAVSKSHRKAIDSLKKYLN